MKSQRVYILILNWNGWVDTIECLESVFRLNYDNYRVIVCDNDSSDNSLEHIKAWAEGRLDVYVSPDNPLRYLSFPPVRKPIAYRQYDRNSAEVGGSKNDTGCPLILIQNGANLGFAGGNNVGLRYALARQDAEYVWLLNNDTVVEPDALRALLDKAAYYYSRQSKVGIIGSKLMYYHSPETLQGVGGVYNKWFATGTHFGVFEHDTGQYDSEDVCIQTDYPIGASMFVLLTFIREVGLMCEDYFLYYEEIDWVMRGKAKEWQTGYSWESRIFHKEGAAIGSSFKGTAKSELSDYYGLLNRILFTRKVFPRYLWSVRLGFIFVILNRIRRGQFNRIKLVFDCFLGKPFDTAKRREQIY